MRTVFAAKDPAVQATTPKGLPTRLILEALHELEDAPWSHLKEPLNGHSLAWRLHDYGIKSETNARAIALPISTMHGAAIYPPLFLPPPKEASQASQASLGRHFKALPVTLWDRETSQAGMIRHMTGQTPQKNQTL